jgi:hypothetical protein
MVRLAWGFPFNGHVNAIEGVADDYVTNHGEN